jgi:hypothetical protein
MVTRRGDRRRGLIRYGVVVIAVAMVSLLNAGSEIRSACGSSIRGEAGQVLCCCVTYGGGQCCANVSVCTGGFIPGCVCR